MPRRLKAAIVPACLVALLPAACTPQAPTFRAPVQDASARQHIPDAQWVRAIAWGDADMDDHRRFPVRAITNGGIRFDFRQPSPQSLQRYLPALAALPRATNGRQVTEALDEFLKRNDTIAFLVIKDDALIYEAYFNGYARDSTVTSFSIAKSVVSALVGFAIAEGRIGSVDDQITTYVPELSAGDPRYRYVTLRHLLTMTSGVRYREGGMSWSDDATKYYAPDLRAAAVSSPIAEEPGRAFRYNNFNPLLLGLVLERATGRPVARYLEEKIWKPLGMDAPGSRSLDSALSGSRKWRAHQRRAIDFAKLGRLFLNRGQWNGTDIVPAQWVAESTGVDARDRPESWYRYFWWLNADAAGCRHFYAAGKHGQYIYLVPEQRLMFVRFGRTDPCRCWEDVFEMLAERIRVADDSPDAGTIEPRRRTASRAIGLCDLGDEPKSLPRGPCTW